MQSFFDINYAGAPFVLFGSAHLGLVAFAALVGGLLIRAGRRADPVQRARLRKGLGLFFIINETGTHIWKLNYGIWTVEETLPLQLCGAMAWVSGVVLFFGWSKAWPMLYFFGLGGALQGVLTPDAGVYGFPHYQMVETILVHSALVIGGLWVVIVEGYRPTFRHLVLILVGLNLAALVMYFVNVGLGSNYLFVNAKPPNASIVDLMPEWPWYIPVLEVIAITLFTLLYLPFASFWRRLMPARQGLPG